MKVEIRRSTRGDKKYMAILPKRTIHFGGNGYTDFTHHGDTNKKYAYMSRHQANEDWTKSGINTAGFWAKHILWNEPSLQESARDVSRRFGLSVQVINVG